MTIAPQPRTLPAERRPQADPALLAMAEAIPQLLLELLERRYLNDFDPAQWRAADHGESGGARPLLRAVRAMGRPAPDADWNAALPHVLTACHGSGHTTMVAVHGDGSWHRLYWGGRRIPGVSRGSTEEFLQAQGGALAAHVPGLDLAPAAPLDGHGQPELAAFLESAPVLGMLTGIPAPADGLRSAAFQSLDRLTAALGTRRYSVLVVAEPLDTAELDRSLDLCRRLRGEVRGLVRRSVSVRQDESESVNVSTTTSQESPNQLPVLLLVLANFCAATGPKPLKVALDALMPLLDVAVLAGNGPQEKLSTQTSQGTSTSTSYTYNADLVNENAEACELLLQEHIDRLQSARSNGWWRTAVYLAADGEDTLEALAGTLRSIWSGETTALDPLRLLRLPAATLRAAAVGARILPLTPRANEAGHPLGPAFDALATCVTSAELSIQVGLPRRDIPGLPMHDTAEFALSVAAPNGGGIALGKLRDAQGREHQQVALSAGALNRHVFITGMTGYGKTTTAKRLILEAYTELGVPFLVLEPAKAEYRALVAHPALAGRLHVYCIGADAARPLRLNPFTPVASVQLSRHIDLVKAVFNASFPMFAGMSYVLEDAMLEVYAERGWNLHTSANDVLGSRPSAADVNALVPSIADLYNKIEQVLDRRQYGREVHQNMGAALRSRLRSLIVGTKGMALDTRRSVSATDLFTHPCVIELRNLGDDEEKSFVMALLLCQLFEYAESRQTGPVRAAGPRLAHVTLIEEAHRLLRAAGPTSGGEAADAQAKAVAMFTDMLAEMRAYGEGFIVADQVPAKLAPEILKNTAVKIVHRLVAADDRRALAATANLTDCQERHLANLPPGTAVVHDEEIGSAVLVRIERPQQAERAGRAEEPADSSGKQPDGDERPPLYLERNGGCRLCPRPCAFLPLFDRPGARAAADLALAGFFDSLLFADAERLWTLWEKWRGAEWLTLPQGVGESGPLYCAFTQAGNRWLGRLLRPLAADAAPDTEAVLLGPQLLAQDRGARVLAGLCSGWLAADDLDAAARALLDETRAELIRAAVDRPPTELPGCAACPARCRMLPLVTQMIPRFADAVLSCTSRPGTADSRVRQLESLTREHLPEAAATVATGAHGKHLMYCVAVTGTAHANRNRRGVVPGAETAAVEELLAHLRE